MEGLGVEFDDRGSWPDYRIPHELTSAIQADRAFRAYHIENCPGCFPEECEPKTYLVKVRPSGKIVRSPNPSAKHPKINITPSPRS